MWLSRLQAKDYDPELVPAIKLMGWWKSRFGEDTNKEKQACCDQYVKGKEVIFETSAAMRDSAALRESPDVIETGLVSKFVTFWNSPDVER